MLSIARSAGNLGRDEVEIVRRMIEPDATIGSLATFCLFRGGGSSSRGEGVLSGDNGDGDGLSMRPARTRAPDGGVDGSPWFALLVTFTS